MMLGILRRILEDDQDLRRAFYNNGFLDFGLFDSAKTNDPIIFVTNLLIYFCYSNRHPNHFLKNGLLASIKLLGECFYTRGSIARACREIVKLEPPVEDEDISRCLEHYLVIDELPF